MSGNALNLPSKNDNDLHDSKFKLFEEVHLPKCDAVCTGRTSMAYPRKVFSPCSESKSKSACFHSLPFDLEMEATGFAETSANKPDYIESHPGR
jgi:hypothetical protein